MGSFDDLEDLVDLGVEPIAGCRKGVPGIDDVTDASELKRIEKENLISTGVTAE